TIAAQLSRARGYGIYFTLANQLVSQLRDNGGEFGELIYHAILGNTHNKIVFRASTDEADLRPLTRAMFLDQVDVEKVKDEITSFQVVDYEEVRERLSGGSTSITSSHSQSFAVSHTDAHSHTSGSQHGKGWSQNSGTTVPLDPAADASTGSRSESHGDSFSDSESEQDATSSSESASESIGESHGHAKTKSWTESVRTRPVVEERVSSRTFESIENQLFTFDQQIASLPARYAYVKLAGADGPRRIRTLDTPDALSGSLLIEHCRSLVLDQLPFALPKAIAEANLAHIAGAVPALAVAEESDELVTFARKRGSPRAALKGAGNDD